MERVSMITSFMEHNQIVVSIVAYILGWTGECHDHQHLSMISHFNAALTEAGTTSRVPGLIRTNQIMGSGHSRQIEQG